MIYQPSPSIPREEASDDPIIRTVLGDLSANKLGICGAHEHIIIDNFYIEDCFPEFFLNDVSAACVDMEAFRDAGGGWVVDTMPTGAGRNVAKLHEVAERTGIPIVCPTGVHLAMYYPPDHPLLKMDRRALTELFIREVTVGVDDGEGISDIRAGVIKVAGGEDHLNTFQQEVFIAAAQAQARTGCPIITHCEKGTAGLKQAALLERHGADLSRVVLSHCDRVNDLSYHRDLLATGVRLEYDQHFRQITRGEPCHTVKLLAALADDYPDQLVVGMDIARRRNWQGYGGEPGLAWLATALPALLANAGLDQPIIDGIMLRNARAAYAMRAPQPTAEPQADRQA